MGTLKVCVWTLLFRCVLAASISTVLCSTTSAGDSSVIPTELFKAVELRDAEVRRIGYRGTTRCFRSRPAVQGENETDDAFIARCSLLTAEFLEDDLPIQLERDFDSQLFHFRLGSVGQVSPRFEEFLDDGKATVKLFETVKSEIQATIGGAEHGRYATSTEGIPRLDIVAFRPISSLSLSVVLHNAVSAENAMLRDPWNRPPISVTKAEDFEGWSVNFRHLSPAVVDSSGTKGRNVSWFRLDIEIREGKAIISRIDELNVVGAGRSLPLLVSMLEDYRVVDGVLVPHRLRCLRFGQGEFQGSVTAVESINLNESVTFPQRLEIPPGTFVTDFVKHRKFRTASDGNVTDIRVAESLMALRQDSGPTFSFWRWGPLVLAISSLAIVAVAFLMRNPIAK